MTDPTRSVVAHVAAYYPPRLGGLERVASTLAELLADRWDVEVLTTACGAGTAPATETPSAGLRVRRFRAWELAHTPLSVGLVWGLLRLPRQAIVHLHLAQAFLPEVVWFTCRLRRRPYVVHFHLDVDPSGRFGWLLPAYKHYVLGPVLRRAAAVLALSPAQAAFLVDHYGVRRHRITVLPNGVGRAYFDIRPAADPVDRPMTLLFAGRLDAQKNVHRLLDAIAQVTVPLDVVIAGDGGHRHSLEQRAAQLEQHRIRFVGAQTEAELLDWYGWADTFVLPSDKEGMPLVLLEAMAAGLAIVATDVPGIRELVGGVGLLAAPRPDALGSALQRVAVDNGLRRELAARSRERSSSLHWDGRVDQLERVYDAVGATA